MHKIGKALGIFGVSVSVAFTGVCAFWVAVLPSPLAAVACLFGILHTIMWIKLLPEFGLMKGKA